MAVGVNVRVGNGVTVGVRDGVKAFTERVGVCESRAWEVPRAEMALTVSATICSIGWKVGGMVLISGAGMTLLKFSTHKTAPRSKNPIIQTSR